MAFYRVRKYEVYVIVEGTVFSQMSDLRVDEIIGEEGKPLI